MKKSQSIRYTVLTPELLAIARKNGIPDSTTRYRVKKGWALERAVTEKPKTRNNSVRGELGFYTSKNKGENRSFRLEKQHDKKLDRLIEESNLNQSDFIAEIVTRWLAVQR